MVFGSRESQLQKTQGIGRENSGSRPSDIALHPRFGGKMRSTKRRNLMRLFCRVFLIVLLFTVAARAADNKQPVISEHTFTVQLPAAADQSEDSSSRDFSPKI